MPIEIALQGEEEMCVKTDNTSKVKHRIIFLKFLQEIVGLIPFLHSKKFYHIATFFHKTYCLNGNILLLK